MQCQMEVWDLEECDFLETVFKPYDNEEEFNINRSTKRFSHGYLPLIQYQRYESSSSPSIKRCWIIFYVRADMSIPPAKPVL